MKLQPHAPLCSRTGLKHLLLVALAYWLFLAMTHYTLMSLPWLQFRFATFVPVAGGLLFGLPGAIGAGLGNFLSDMFGSTPMPIRLGAALLNFFLAYLPYRLWFGWRGKNALRFISDSGSFARFVGIAVLNGFLFAVALCALLDIFYHKNASIGFGFFVLFSNNYDFPVLLGLPLLLHWWRRSEDIYYPAPQAKSYGRLQLPALGLLTLLDLGYLTFAQFDVMTEPVSLVVFTLNVLLLGYVCTLPPQCELPEGEPGAASLAGETTELLLNFVTGSILLSMLAILLTVENISAYTIYPQKMRTFYLLLCLVINGSFVSFYLLLRWLERTISRPLNALSLRASQYMESNDEEAIEESEGEAPARNEVEVLNQSFTQMTKDLKQYVADLTTASEARHAIQAQLDVASQIQQGTLPNLTEVNAALEAKNCPYLVKGSMKAAKHVGGDMFDCYLMDEDHLLLNVGDVAGKGIPAALFAMVTQALLSNNTYNKAAAVTNLSEIVEKVNNALEENNQEVLFVTLWVGVLELSTGKLTYVNAGHNPSLLAKKDGSDELSLLEEISGPVLGLMSEISYNSYTTLLPPGHKLLIFTDGLSEAENAAHEFYGDERLREVFLKAQAPEEIMADIEAFVGDAPPSDDRTYLWVEHN